MATLFEYFQNDFQGLSIDQTVTFTNQQSGLPTEVVSRTVHSMDASTALNVFYIPEIDNPWGICEGILRDLDQLRASVQVQVIGGFHEDTTLGEAETRLSNRIYFYTGSEMPVEKMGRIEALAVSKGLQVTIRGPKYLSDRIRLQMPQAFISHDSRDKILIARPLAEGLSSRLCPVWYDEYSLKIGDSLRESIEKGIKEAKKCVLVLTQNFLANPGWGRKEFNSIFTREMVCQERVVLPVWYGITTTEVYEYSPSLADTVGLKWPSPDSLSEDEYKKQVQELISKLHTAITAT